MLESATGIKAKETVRLASKDIAVIVDCADHADSILTDSTSWIQVAFPDNTHAPSLVTPAILTNQAIVVHGVPTTSNTSDKSEHLRQLIGQLESDNGIKIKKGKWAVSEHRLNQQSFSTLIIETETKEDQERALKNRSFSHHNRILTTEHFRPPSSRPQQCTNCFRFGHVERNCRAKVICGLCAGPHRTSEHTGCGACCASPSQTPKGCTCAHQVARCNNCNCAHEAFSDLCEVRNEYFASHQPHPPNQT